MSMFHRVLRAPHKAARTALWNTNRNAVVLNWATEGVIAKNWGDKLNPYIAEKISGKRVLHRADVYPIGNNPIYYFIGSHLATACGDPRAVVWGAGFISSDVTIRNSPRKIHAVRGWLSNQRLLDSGLDAPFIVGDAAMMLPYFYKPKRIYERRAAGIIPHCFEWDVPFFVRTREWEDARVIDICGDIEDVIEQIVACDKIFSSSLHGIICADAYGLPAYWLHASNKPKGDGFKFRDYFSSVGRPDQDPFHVSDQTTQEDLNKILFDYRVKIDLDALAQSCPLGSFGMHGRQL